MRVVVFGATGDQGSAQVRALARAGHDPVAVSRRPQALAIDGRRIATFAADFADLPSLAAALQGADAAFLNLPSTSFQVAEPLVAAVGFLARAAADSPSIRSLVFNTSLPVPQDKLGFAAQDARHEMRRLLFASGTPTVSIEPVVFLDNWLKGWAWPAIEQHGKLVYAHKPDLAVSWICHDDLAALMLAALARPELAGRSFPVGGAETVCLPELAEKLGRAWNRPLGWESLGIDDFCQRMRQVFEGRSSLEADRLIAELHRIYTWYNNAPEQPFKVDMRPVLRELPVHLTTIEEWARRQRLPDAAGATAMAHA
ncbi:MAG TPA: SDR family oxidoreductase [Ramlibacter sp.]|nr:SDR family oxidoreductase [Ramlibacter sp.]